LLCPRLPAEDVSVLTEFAGGQASRLNPTAGRLGKGPAMWEKRRRCGKNPGKAA
jgi:hypothetical protein